MLTLVIGFYLGKLQEAHSTMAQTCTNLNAVLKSVYTDHGLHMVALREFWDLADDIPPAFTADLEHRQWRREYINLLISQKRFTEAKDPMAEWKVMQWRSSGMSALECPNCGAATFASSVELAVRYNLPQAGQPYMKCLNCDFQPYLPLEFKESCVVEVVLSDENGTVWSTVEESIKPVKVSKHGIPKMFEVKDLAT